MKKIIFTLFLATTLTACSYFEDKHLRIGKDWYDIEEYDKAIEVLNKVFEEEPKSLKAREYIALSYTHLENYRSALAVRRKIIKIDSAFDYSAIDKLLTENALRLLTSESNRLIDKGFYILDNIQPRGESVTQAVAKAIYDSQEWQYIEFLQYLTPNYQAILEEQLNKRSNQEKNMSLGIYLMNQFGSQIAKNYVYQQIENNYLDNDDILGYLKRIKNYSETDYKLGKWEFMRKLFAKTPLYNNAFTELLNIAKKDEIFMGSGRTENNIAYMVDARGLETDCNTVFDRAVKTAFDSSSTLHLDYNEDLTQNIMLNYLHRVEHCINDDNGRTRMKSLGRTYKAIYDYSTDVFRPFEGFSNKVSFARGYYNLLGNWLIDGNILPEHKTLYSDRLLSDEGSIARWGLKEVSQYKSSYNHQPDFIDAIINPTPPMEKVATDNTATDTTNGKEKNQVATTKPAYKDFKYIGDFQAFLTPEDLLITPVFIFTDRDSLLHNKSYVLFMENTKLDRGIVMYMAYGIDDDIATPYWKMDKLFIDTAETVKKIRQALYARRVAVNNDRLGMNGDLYDTLKANNWKPISNLSYLGINTDFYASRVVSNIHIDGLSVAGTDGYYSLDAFDHFIWRINGQTIESECGDGHCIPLDERFNSTENQPIPVLGGCRMSVSREKQAIVFDIDANDCPRKNLHQEIQQKITQTLMPSLQESHEKACQLLEKAFANETWQRNGGCTEENVKSFIELLLDTKSLLPTMADETDNIIRYTWFSNDEPPPIIDLKRNGDKLDVIGYYID